MSEQAVSGTWRIAQSTDPTFRKGATARLEATDRGLRIAADGSPSVEVPWGVLTLSAASNGQVVIGTGRGTLWADPGPDANPAALTGAFATARPAPASPSPYEEYPAGDGRILVLYRGDDTGNEVDPADLLAEIGADAAARAAAGWQLTSMAGLPLRHAGQKFLAAEGSGYTTKVAIGCLYVRAPQPA